MHVTLKSKQHSRSAEVRREGDRFLVTDSDGTVHEVQAAAAENGRVRLVVDGRSYRVAIHRHGLERHVGIAGETYCFTPDSSAHSSHSLTNVSAPEIVAPMPGKILEVLVQVGDRVEVGQGLVILEAMKMETRLSAETAGMVAEIRIVAGATVDGGSVLMVMQFDA